MDAPRTDAIAELNFDPAIGYGVAAIDLSRQLERENAELRGALKLADQHLKLLYPGGVDGGDFICCAVHNALLHD